MNWMFIKFSQLYPGHLLYFLSYKLLAYFSRTLLELLSFHSRVFLFYECNDFRIFVKIPIKIFKSPLSPSLPFYSSLFSKISCPVFLIFSFVWEPKTFPGRLQFCWRVFIQLYSGVHISVAHCSECSMWSQLLWLLWAILHLKPYLLSCFSLHFPYLLTKRARQNNDPQRCPLPNPWNFWYAALHSRRDFAM